MASFTKHCASASHSRLDPTERQRRWCLKSGRITHQLEAKTTSDVKISSLYWRGWRGVIGLGSSGSVGAGWRWLTNGEVRLDSGATTKNARWRSAPCDEGTADLLYHMAMPRYPWLSRPGALFRTSPGTASVVLVSSKNVLVAKKKQGERRRHSTFGNDVEPP